MSFQTLMLPTFPGQRLPGVIPSRRPSPTLSISSRALLSFFPPTIPQLCSPRCVFLLWTSVVDGRFHDAGLVACIIHLGVVQLFNVAGVRRAPPGG